MTTKLLPESCSRCDYFDHTYQLEPHCNIKHQDICDWSKQPPKWCPLRNLKLTDTEKRDKKLVDMKMEFRKIYGSRPDWRPISALDFDIQGLKDELKKLKELRNSCEKYDSLWQGYMSVDKTGNEEVEK